MLAPRRRTTTKITAPTTTIATPIPMKASLLSGRLSRLALLLSPTAAADLMPSFCFSVAVRPSALDCCAEDANATMTSCSPLDESVVFDTNRKSARLKFMLPASAVRNCAGVRVRSMVNLTLFLGTAVGAGVGAPVAGLLVATGWGVPVALLVAALVPDGRGVVDAADDDGA